MKGLVLGVVLMSLAIRAAAQPPDSLRADSLQADTTDFSALFLRTAEAIRIRVPVYPYLGRRDLSPRSSRLVFDRDTMEWHNAQTVSDLLTKIPGVFVWRGGWVGRPEPINFQGRGAASTEFLIDGVPFLPLGPDSVSVDPSLFPLSFFDRVEVEPLPGTLRVHLFTRRHDRLPPRTRIAVASGDFDIARYVASLERRSNGGFGFAVAAEHLAVPDRNGFQGSYSNTQAWLQASYLPKSGRLAGMAQWIRAGPNRETFLTPALVPPQDTLSQGLDGARSELQASVTYRADADGLGLSGSLIAARSSWSEDSTAVSLGGPDRHVRFVDQGFWQFGGRVNHRTRVSSLGGEVWHRTRWTPLDARASLALAPVPAVAVSAEGVYQRHDQARTSRWVTARGSIALPLGFKASAFGRTGTILPHPLVSAALPQSVTDFGLLGGIEHPRLAVEAGLWRTAAFAPETFPLYRIIDSIRPLGARSWVTVRGRLAPRQWFILDGWYSNPRGGPAEGIPPTHSILSATIQSKFLRTFRSGIFGLKLQGSMESWGAGVIGRDASGQPITLPGATLFRGLLQIRIGDFVAFYDRANMQGTDQGYLPGLPVRAFASTFGVKWEFTN
jgi:hypothetical protein